MINKEFLESVGVTDEEVITKITTEYSTDVQAVQTLLDTANTTIKSYEDMDIESIKSSVEDYKQKWEQSEKDRLDFEHNPKINSYIKGLNLKDDVYEKTLNDIIKEKQLKFENDKLIGGDDIVESFKEKYPYAFEPKLQSAGPTGGTPQMDGVEKAFAQRNPHIKL